MCIIQEAKKLKTSENEVTIWEDISLSDVEDHKDQPVPMSLEHSKFEMREKDQMVCTLCSFLLCLIFLKVMTNLDWTILQEEIEMEDIFEETGTDIDGGDATDPLAVVEYVEDIYAYYKKMEVRKGQYAEFSL